MLTLEEPLGIFPEKPHRVRRDLTPNALPWLLYVGVWKDHPDFGSAKQVSLADRSVFQRAIAEADLRLRAACNLMSEVFECAWQTVCSGRSPEPQQQAEMRSAATFATDVTLGVTSMAFRYGGGSAVRLDSISQRGLRDLYVGASHLMVSYEHYGQALLGLTDIDPLG